MISPTRTAFVMALAAATLLMTGCSLPSPEQIIGDTVEQTIENATGSEIDVVGADLPAEWPGLPTPDAPLTSAFSVDGSYSLSYQLPDDAEVLRVQQELLDLGFEKQGDYSADVSAVILENDEWHVVLTWYIVDGSDYFFAYAVSPISR